MTKKFVKNRLFFISIMLFVIFIISFILYMYSVKKDMDVIKVMSRDSYLFCLHESVKNTKYSISPTDKLSNARVQCQEFERRFCNSTYSIDFINDSYDTVVKYDIE